MQEVKINGVFNLRGAAGSENCRGVEIIPLESNRAAFKRQTDAGFAVAGIYARPETGKMEPSKRRRSKRHKLAVISGSLINRLRELRLISSLTSAVPITATLFSRWRLHDETANCSVRACFHLFPSASDE